jgi:hypothetical protein
MHNGPRPDEDDGGAAVFELRTSLGSKASCSSATIRLTVPDVPSIGSNEEPGSASGEARGGRRLGRSTVNGTEETPTANELWAGIGRKVDSARFHFERMDRELQPPELTPHQIVMHPAERSSGAIGTEPSTRTSMRSYRPPEASPN